MQLTDLITEEEERGLREYISQIFYKDKEAPKFCNDIPLNQIFKVYNKNKRTMFKALGKQLRRTFEVTIQSDKMQQRRDLKDLYWYNSQSTFLEGMFWSFSCRNQAQFTGHTSNAHLSKMLMFFRQKIYDAYDISQTDLITKATEEDFFSRPYFKQDEFKYKVFPKWREAFHLFFNIYRIFDYENILTGKLCYDIDEIEILEVRPLKKGMKIMKALRQLLQRLGFQDWNTFEKFRNSISDLNFSDTKTVKITFSCHPADLLSLSDNANDWHSCYSLLNHGGYSLSPLEMLNSNNVIVAYIESKNKFMNGRIPSKSWRCLLYVTKDLLLLGKSYPYYWKALDEKTIELAAQMIASNLKWTYRYQKQNYNDTVFLYDTCAAEELEYFSKYDVRGKKIVLKTNLAYNDIVQDALGVYLCYRNIPKEGKVINVSGPATCLICGNKLNNRFFKTSICECDSCKERSTE